MNRRDDAPMTTAKARRAVLQELLSGGRASTQAELCELLAARGHAAAQSTVSRDLKRLGALRAMGADGEPVYRLGTGSSVPRGLSAGMVTAIEHNEVLIVLRTSAGRAQVVGIELDDLDHPEILGTLAGDDTVLVVPRQVARLGELVQSLRELAGVP
jgi:transcriptional regulator of arginine metabolism